MADLPPTRGITLLTPSHSLRIFSLSRSVRNSCQDRRTRVPPFCTHCFGELTMIRLPPPTLLNSETTFFRKPSPMETVPVIAATPMSIPKRVSRERILLARSWDNPTAVGSRRFISFLGPLRLLFPPLLLLLLSHPLRIRGHLIVQRKPPDDLSPA